MNITNYFWYQVISKVVALLFNAAINKEGNVLHFLSNLPNTVISHACLGSALTASLLVISVQKMHRCVFYFRSLVTPQITIPLCDSVQVSIWLWTGQQQVYLK